MINKEWLEIQITEARNSNPSVNDTVAKHINELLNGQLSEQQLTPAELKKISITLLQEMDFDLSEKGGR